MLDQKQIKALVLRLREDHTRVIKAAEALEHANQAYTNLEARLLYFHPFEGKNAQQREWEATVVLGDNEELMEMRDARFKRDIDLARAKAELDISREAIALWRALAYQAGDSRE